jgi:hypothetical protein
MHTWAFVEKGTPHGKVVQTLKVSLKEELAMAVAAAHRSLRRCCSLFYLFP